jgi:hypothetical protein
MAALLLCFLLFRDVGSWNIPWWRITGKVLLGIDRFKIFTSEHPIDFSAGAVQLSNPDKDTIPLVEVQKKRVNGTEIDAPDDDYNKPPLLLTHQMGRRVVKRLPDAALLGIIVLILSELLQRETKTNFVRLPPVLRAIVNETAGELDTKLEFLSSMQWSVEPFLRKELENLQTQPLELLDKYIVTDILPRVDKEISPILNNLVGDPKTVKQITSSIKDLIQVTSVVLVQSGGDWSWEEFTGLREKNYTLGNNGVGGRGGLSRYMAGEQQQQQHEEEEEEKEKDRKPSPFDSATASILDGVDSIGDMAQRAIESWNNLLFELKKSTKATSVIDSKAAASWRNLFTGGVVGAPSDTFKRATSSNNSSLEADLSSGVPVRLGVSAPSIKEEVRTEEEEKEEGGGRKKTLWGRRR